MARRRARRKALTPRPPAVYVDCDGTLEREARSYAPVIDELHRLHSLGFEIIIWSARGEEHARTVATRCGVSDLAKCILGKPTHYIDNDGWRWLRYTQDQWPVDGD